MADLRFLAFALLACACSSPPKPEPTPVAPVSSASSAPAPEVSSTPSTTPPVASTTASAAAPEENTSAPPPSAPAGETDPQVALANAKKENKAALLVFCAKYVASCGELAHVLTDRAVKKALDERFVVARVDLSNDEDAATKERMKRYNVKGLPLMIVFDRKGKEVAREASSVDAQKLSKLLDKAK